MSDPSEPPPPRHASGTLAPVAAQASGSTRIAVLGAGIVGASVALQLQRAGLATTLLDARPAGHGASFGNAGLISIDSCVPLAIPGLLRQVPGWLLDPDGPLSIRLRHLPRALPWLWRRLRLARTDAALACSDAMRSLHAPALSMYRELLGARAFDGLIRQSGQVHVWKAPAHGRVPDSLEDRLRRRQGIDARWLSPPELHDLLPGIAPGFERALLYPNNAHTVDPRGLVQALVRAFVDAGGVLETEHALKLLPLGEGRVRVITDVGDRLFSHVVVANGIGAAGLVRTLGVHLPLQAERGYSVRLATGQGSPALPVVYRDRGFVLTPMSDGLRLAGTVEIAAHDDPPDERRAQSMIAHARQLLPGLDTRTRPAVWVGSRPSTPDGLPVIDRVAGVPGLVLACGHSHFGLTAAPMTGHLVLHLLLDRAPALDPSPYALSRFHGALSRSIRSRASSTSASSSPRSPRAVQR